MNDYKPTKVQAAAIKRFVKAKAALEKADKELSEAYSEDLKNVTKETINGPILTLPEESRIKYCFYQAYIELKQFNRVQYPKAES